MSEEVRRMGNGTWMATNYPAVYLFWTQWVQYPVMSRVVRAQRAWMARGGRCWPKDGAFSGQRYCGRHGRAAGWPCRSWPFGVDEDGHEVRIVL